MMRVAGPADVPALEAFLKPHAASSMFLRGNLKAHGVQNHTHPHGTRYFLWESQGQIKGVIGITNRGYLTCQAPDAADSFWHSCAQVLQGRSVQGMTGVPEQVAALTRALGFAPAQFARQDRQPLYMIELSGVIMPMASKLALRSPVSEDQVWLAAWMSQNYADTGFPPPQGAKYTDLAADFIAKPDARLMCHEETPVAMSNFNARTHDMVQLGGVFVPPEHRGNGWGGAIVALHLAEARDTGIETAILFAASPFAARAYERIGFRRIGDYQIALLKAPCEVAA